MFSKIYDSRSNIPLLSMNFLPLLCLNEINKYFIDEYKTSYL